jgi:pimeloyl-ACP methyl ester carboxylesterase
MMSKDKDASGRMSRRTSIKASIAIGAAAMTARTGTIAAAAVAGANPVVPVAIPQQVPAIEGIATLPGVRIGYWDTQGDGPTVVLVHPATGSARIWVYQQPVFARAGYRVIAFSRRGYANSDPVPKSNPGSASVDLHNLVEFLRVPKFHLVGSAAGGQVSIDYALSHPDRLYSLTLACAVGGITDKEYTDMAARIRPAGYAEMPAEFRELSPSYRAMNPEGTAKWVELEHGAITGNRFGQTNVNPISLAGLGGLNVPTLVIGGDSDLGAPPPMLRMYAARIPGAELQIVPEGGHSLYWEQPELFNRTLLDFFSRHSS